MLARRPPSSSTREQIFFTVPIISTTIIRKNTQRECQHTSSRSTSSAYRFPPCSATGVTFPLERSVMSASPNECAGSVLSTRVRNPSSANLIAIAALVLVLPTPPFPPTSMYRRPGNSARRRNEESCVDTAFDIANPRVESVGRLSTKVVRGNGCEASRGVRIEFHFVALAG